MKTSPLICRANQWTGFYKITVSVMKELNKNYKSQLQIMLFFSYDKAIRYLKEAIEIFLQVSEDEIEILTVVY